MTEQRSTFIRAQNHLGCPIKQPKAAPDVVRLIAWIGDRSYQLRSEAFRSAAVDNATWKCKMN